MISTCEELLIYCNKNSLEYRELEIDALKAIISQWRQEFKLVELGGFHIKKGLKGLCYMKKNRLQNIYAFNTDYGCYGYYICCDSGLVDDLSGLFNYIVDIDFSYYLHSDSHVENGFTYYEKY